MTFPPSHAIVYRNEAGEVLGWDIPPDPSDPHDLYDDDAWLNDRDIPVPCPTCARDLWDNECCPVCEEEEL